MTSRSRIAVAILSFVVLASVVVAAWLAMRDGGSARPPEAATSFICPMHPEIVQDAPGSCPICGMDLVPASAPSAEAPAIHDDASTSRGRTRVRLPEAESARIRARAVPAATVRFEREVRAVGTVVVDERRLRQVHTKTAGWVERLYADAEGETVSLGDPLLAIYSPELLAAQEEFLVAARARALLGASPSPDVAASGEVLRAAARSRLRLLDVTDAEIDALAERGRAERIVVVASPISGTILKRGVAAGARVEPGTLLLEVADLTVVWVRAQVFESDLPFVREGQRAIVTLPYLPGRELRGRVERVYPTVDPGSRTASVRLSLPNPDGSLRPDMFAEVRLVGDLGERLSVPVEAVLETGARGLVFVAEGDGVFAPREIRTGLRLPDRVEVLEGLVEGDEVLARGNFFVDSESKLRAALEAASPR